MYVISITHADTHVTCDRIICLNYAIQFNSITNCSHQNESTPLCKSFNNYKQTVSTNYTCHKGRIYCRTVLDCFWFCKVYLINWQLSVGERAGGHCCPFTVGFVAAKLRGRLSVVSKFFFVSWWYSTAVTWTDFVTILASGPDVDCDAVLLGANWKEDVMLFISLDCSTADRSLKKCPRHADVDAKHCHTKWHFNILIV